MEHDQPDIVCFTEILSKNSKFAVQSAELQADGYDCFSNICDIRVHSGVAVYVKDIWVYNISYSLKMGRDRTVQKVCGLKFP